MVYVFTRSHNGVVILQQVLRDPTLAQNLYDSHMDELIGTYGHEAVMVGQVAPTQCNVVYGDETDMVSLIEFPAAPYYYTRANLSPEWWR